MNNSDWTPEETRLLIQKRLKLFGCARSSRIYDQISDYLYQKHNICQNPSSCQSRFNNLLKTYRVWVKRLEKDADSRSRMRFPFFDMFHQYYTNPPDKDDEEVKWKSVISLDDTFEDSSCSLDAEKDHESPPIQNELDKDAELGPWMGVDRGLDDLKMRLMEQKLLYFTNQNMLLQDQQHLHQQQQQERARDHLTNEKIPKVLRRINSCLAKNPAIKIVPPSAEKIASIEDPSSLVVPTDVKSCEAGKGEKVVKKPKRVRLKVRKNTAPAWNRIQTVLLIKIHCDLRPTFKEFNLFECISNKLKELHINRTRRDCRTRWNNLLRSYRDCRLRQELNDKAAVKFEYFDEIHAYYKDRPV